MRDIAKREHIPCLDLTVKSHTHFLNDFRSTQAIRDAYSYDDFTHFN